MLEKDIENLIAQHPAEFFPNEGLRLVAQQATIDGRRIDVLFADRHDRQIIVEVKRGILTREASGQVAEYYGLMKNQHPDKTFELVLAANVIPPERRTFLETIGIECLELGIVKLGEVARKHGYRFLDEGPIDLLSPPTIPQVAIPASRSAPTVWIFQANPERYDILNALNDPKIGNSIHWLVKQHRNDIHRGHMALIWMSGKEAGIYALGRVESEPVLQAENESERAYWLGDDEKVVENRVRLSILKRYVNGPILRSRLKAFSELASLSILRQGQGSNFPVRDGEWEFLSQLL